MASRELIIGSIETLKEIERSFLSKKRMNKAEFKSFVENKIKDLSSRLKFIDDKKKRNCTL